MAEDTGNENTEDQTDGQQSEAPEQEEQQASAPAKPKRQARSKKSASKRYMVRCSGRVTGQLWDPMRNTRIPPKGENPVMIEFDPTNREDWLGKQNLAGLLDVKEV